MSSSRSEKNEPPIAIVGPGAIGLLLAHRLPAAGARVLLLGKDASWVRGARRGGLAIEVRGARGKTRRVAIRGAEPIAQPKGPVCSTVFLCIKSSDTAAALRGARPLIGPDTAVVSLQNGLTHRPTVLSTVGRKRAVFGVAFASVERTAPGRAVHHGGERFSLAYLTDNASAVQRAGALLKSAGFKVDMVRDEDALLWTKAAFNAAVNPIGALTGRTNGELIAIPALRELVFRAAREASEAARADGHRLLRSNLEGSLIRGLRAAPAQSNSMLQDLRAGRTTEIRAIVDPFLAAARRRGRRAPMLEALRRIVVRLESELA